MPKPRPCGAEPQVAEGCQVEAAGYGRAVHSGEHRLLQLVDTTEERERGAHVLEAAGHIQFAQVLKVEPGAERGSRSSNYYGSNPIVRLRFV